MVKKKLELEKSFNDQVLEQISARNFEFVNPAKTANFSKTQDGKIGGVLKQRHNQREILFYFALWFVAVTTAIVFGLILYQAHLNVTQPNVYIRLINDHTLQIIVAGVFVQFVGLVGIITRSIWNDKPYLDAGVMGKNVKESDVKR